MILQLDCRLAVPCLERDYSMLQLSRSGSASGQQALLGASALAMVTGPSFGRWYAGEASLPTIGVGDEEPPVGLFWPALAVVAGTTIYDIYKAKSGIDAYNARQRKAASKLTYTISPVASPTSKGIATGLAIQGRF
jgi:autotransporter adhesin